MYDVVSNMNSHYNGMSGRPPGYGQMPQQQFPRPPGPYPPYGPGAPRPPHPAHPPHAPHAPHTPHPPNVQAPQLNEWGPCLWRILHALAERSNKIIAIRGCDEIQRCWVNIINALTKSLPCPMCRNHYKDYISRYRFDENFKFTGEERKNKIRDYFFKFHNFVRLSKAQEIEINSLDEVSKLYSEYNVTKYKEDYKIVIEHMKRAVIAQTITHEDMVRAARSIEEIWRVLN